MNKNHVMLGSGSTVGPYELLECIGRGGMADVYLGIKRSVSDIRRFYAIKAIRPHMASDDRFGRMLVDEARVMANIRHPNLVNLHEVLEERGHHFIVMDYLRGVDLRRIQKELDHRDRSLPIPVALGVVRQAALGLHHAHEANSIDGRRLELVHRDVSPHNLFVTFDGFVRVLDFGIAKSSVREELSESGILKGKVPYLSPEQCGDFELDRRTDIYSLGVVLYELTTGRRPFAGKNHMQVIRSIVGDAPLRPVSLNSSIPRSLEEVVLRAVEKQPEERFQTAEALASALDDVAREQNWKIGERVIGSFIRRHYGDYKETLDRRLSELAHASLDGAGGSSEVIEVDYDDIEERVIDLGPDVHATSRRVGNYTLFCLVGGIRESFDYEPMLDRAKAVCIVDLHGVSRVTSFGIRQWLELIPRLREAASRVVLSRVSVPMVNQLVTIPKMSDGVEIASIMAPYRCRNCAHAFDVRIDAGETIAWQIDCARCGEGFAELEEDTSYLAPLADTEPVETELEVLLDELGTLDDPYESRIDKRVSGRTTEITVTGEVPTRTRWDRYLAGVEGDVRIRFEPGSLIDDTQLQRLFAQVRKAARDANLEVWNLPVDPDVVADEQLAAIRSISFASKCSDCDFVQFREWTIGDRSMTSSCIQCGAALERSIENTDTESDASFAPDATEQSRTQKAPSGDETSTDKSLSSPDKSGTFAFVAIVLILLTAIVAVLLF